MKYTLIFLFMLSSLSCTKETKELPYLSNLKADKNSALYTTYAAAIERSEFVLDEGYEFQFYKPEKGMNFVTDNSGELGLGFIIDGTWIYKEADMFKKPTITASYPDLVHYEYYPIQGIKVEAKFLVQSSHTAIWDLNITNETDTELDLQVVPFIQNNYRTYNAVDRKEDAFIFEHQAFPDGWTISHELPYEETIKNVFVISEPDGVSGVFNSLEGESPEIPFAVSLNEPSVFQISGRAIKSNNERFIASPPEARLQVYLNDDKSKLLTENTPLKGIAQPSIDQQGFFRVELGNFKNFANTGTYTFTFYNEIDHLSARYTADSNGATENRRKDVLLEAYSLPAVPQDVRITMGENSNAIRWSGAGENLRYNLYRRSYPEGVYEKIADGLEATAFEDRNVDNASLVGYIIVAENTDTGETGMHSREVNNQQTHAFVDFLNTDFPAGDTSIGDNARVLSFKRAIALEANQTKNVRLVRMVGRTDKSDPDIEQEARSMLQEDLGTYLKANESLFSEIPTLTFEDPDKELLYWSSFNMMRQMFYPPEGESSYNYYVFSREPTWGWGHGGQVFHESITMLAYAYMDPQSAMDSQRVFEERQYESGYINYRTGSYLDEIIEHNEQLTSSAPWYAWQNWEVYKITGDTLFLKQMYESSKAFYNFYVSNRDSDNDGLCEWGGHAVLESVRDALVAVWDEVGWPANFEGVDLNSMLVSEAKALEAMAEELGLSEEASAWRKDHQDRAKLINETFWDEEEGFYFNVDKKDNDFTFENENDLKREEIIGFLPLWAGIATPEQAEKLVEKLTDSTKFWRKYGVPSLAADDPFYNDKGYWNGPVWVEWNFLIVQGLINYGYHKEARELVDRVAEGMVLQLKENHNLWEFYSPDDQWGGYHKSYIWAGIINRMMMDVKTLDTIQ